MGEKREYVKHKITVASQSLKIFKINPNKHDLSEEVDFVRSVHGERVTGTFYICDHALIVENENNVVTGIFSLHHFYFL